MTLAERQYDRAAQKTRDATKEDAEEKMAHFDALPLEERRRISAGESA